jgi:hypothetical protein
MKARSTKRQGLYVSYNENKNGLFDEAVQVSNQPGGLTWLEKSRRNPEQLHCPTDIIVRLTGQDRYFRGRLDAVKSADNLNPNFALEERNHRPSAWRKRDEEACPRPNMDFKSVFFIRILQEVPLPSEVKGRRPPQSPVYVDLCEGA